MGLSAHQFKSVYEDLGYNLSLLGCIMLKIDDDLLSDIVAGAVPEERQYFANDPSRFWIKGNVTNKAHVTLLYGLLRTGPEMRKHVDAVLELENDSQGVLPRTVSVKEVTYFESPYEDEPYYCVVAKLDVTPELQEAHDRLTFLPHINTFPGYEAHVTLAYIDKDEELLERVLHDLRNEVSLREFKTGELDYGGNKG